MSNEHGMASFNTMMRQMTEMPQQNNDLNVYVKKQTSYTM